MINKLIIFLFVLTSCATTLNGKVETFTDNFNPINKTFRILPTDIQSNSLQYKEYSKYIEKIMIANKMIKLESTEERPDYTVTFDYGSNHFDTTHKFYTYYYGNGYSGTNHQQVKWYLRYITIYIYDGKYNKIYESTLLSRGKIGSFHTVAECLFKMLELSFPASNGEITTIKIEPSEAECGIPNSLSGMEDL